MSRTIIYKFIETIFYNYKKIKITDLPAKVTDIVIKDFIDRKDFFQMKIKRVVHELYENIILNKEIPNRNPQINSLEKLKDINMIGKEFDIDRNVIEEIDDSLKDKFIWAEGNYIELNISLNI